MTDISKHALVHPAAQIGRSVRIGPFCVIGPDVVIGDHSQLMNHVTIEGITKIGPNNVFYQNVVIGTAPQDLKYDGAPTQTTIGARNVFRENVTVHRGTELGGAQTTIGDENLFMVAAHIAHDCTIGNRTIVGNQTQLAGHVTIEDGAVVTALIGLHHFVTVGCYSYVGAMTPVRRDVPPFMKFSGDPNEVRGVNEEGLKRNNFTPDDISALKQAHRQLFRTNTISAALDELEATLDLNPHVAELCRFVRQSCASRFGRFRENVRADRTLPKQRRAPVEVRSKNPGKAEEK